MNVLSSRISIGVLACLPFSLSRLSANLLDPLRAHRKRGFSVFLK